MDHALARVKLNRSRQHQAVLLGARQNKVQVTEGQPRRECSAQIFDEIRKHCVAAILRLHEYRVDHAKAGVTQAANHVPREPGRIGHAERVERLGGGGDDHSNQLPVDQVEAAYRVVCAPREVAKEGVVECLRVDSREPLCELLLDRAHIKSGGDPKRTPPQLTLHSTTACPPIVDARVRRGISASASAIVSRSAGLMRAGSRCATLWSA
eukprot:6112955-Prymnesium_polylepis.1